MHAADLTPREGVGVIASDIGAGLDRLTFVMPAGRGASIRALQIPSPILMMLSAKSSTTSAFTIGSEDMLRWARALTINLGLNRSGYFLKLPALLVV